MPGRQRDSPDRPPRPSAGVEPAPPEPEHPLDALAAWALSEGRELVAYPLAVR